MFSVIKILLSFFFINTFEFAIVSMVLPDFEITKFVPDALVLEFSVNDSDTDPKPKVIFEDPIEIDPADDVSH